MIVLDKWSSYRGGRLNWFDCIGKKQYGFVPGRVTVDAVFVVRRLTGKFRAKYKLFFIFLTWIGFQ